MTTETATPRDFAPSLLRPTDLPSLRDRTAEHVAATGYTAYENAINDGRQHLRPMGDTSRAAAHLAVAEVQRLQGADLYYVTAPMADLAVAAGASLPAFNLMPEDLPSMNGFLYFAKPIDVVDYAQYYENEGCSPITAVAWSEWTGGNPAWKRGGVWMTWYADRDGQLESAVQRGLLSRQQADAARSGLGPLLIDNESASPFSPDPIPNPDGTFGADGHENTSIGWIATLKATWLLMTQPLARVEDVAHDRAARRRAEKRGETPPRVRVIHLRRPAGKPGGPGGREYHHQWIVRGHWRQQWYSTREVHRPVWIAPHIKGPADAPLLGGEKVHVWSR